MDTSARAYPAVVTSARSEMLTAGIGPVGSAVSSAMYRVELAGTQVAPLYSYGVFPAEELIQYCPGIHAEGAEEETTGTALPVSRFRQACAPCVPICPT